MRPGISSTMILFSKKSGKVIRSTGFRLSKRRMSFLRSSEAGLSSGNLMRSSPRSIFRSSSTWLDARKGGLPTIISYNTVPTDHRSALASYFSYRKISGAMYSGDPQSVSANEVAGRERAKPKSAIFSIGSDSRPVVGLNESSLPLNGITWATPDR